MLYFHIIILNLNSSQKDIDINFYCRAPFQFNNYPSDKHYVKKVVDYDVPCASNINGDRVYLCCGLFKLEKWEVHHHSCTDIIQPYRQQLLESETAFCDICHKNCISPADFVLRPRTCSFMFAFVCLSYFVISPILLILVYGCTLLTISWGSRNSNFFNLEFQKMYCLFHNPIM